MVFVKAPLYSVWVKDKPSASWRETGIIESNLAAANWSWSDIIVRLGYAAYKLEPIT